jgi:DNA-binding NarL/FixJ family response regulator
VTDAGARVLCVDDHRSFREAMRLAVNAEADLECAGAADSVVDALAVLDEAGADVVLMDFDLADVDGIEGTRRVKAAHPEVRVIVLTALSDLNVFVRAVAAGADGFLAKDAPLETVLAAVRSVNGVGLQIDPDTIRRFRMRVGDRARIGTRVWAPQLTDREKEVLALLAAGLDPQTIARQLGIRIHTCRGYVRNVLLKLGAHSQLEAVAIATQAGLLRYRPDEAWSAGA